MKKKLSIALVLSLCLSLCSVFTAFADDDVVVTPDVTSGTLDDSSVTWNFDTTTGILTLAGTGATPNYTINGDSPVRPPWYSWGSLIKGVVVKEDVETGNQLFLGSVYPNLKKVQIYGSTSKDAQIGAYSFADLRNVEKLVVVNQSRAINVAFRNLGVDGTGVNCYFGNHLGAWYADSVKTIKSGANIYYGAYANLWDTTGTVNCSKNFTSPVLHNCTSESVIGKIDVTVSGKATLDYFCNKDTDAVLILAAYNENGKLIKTATNKVTLKRGDSELVKTVEVTNDAEGVDHYTAYLWDSFTNLTPLLNSTTKSVMEVDM